MLQTDRKAQRMTYTKAGHVGPKFISGAGYAGRVAAVYEHGTTTLATLYTSAAKTSTTPNPTALDDNGLLSFYAVPGLYDVHIGGGVETVTVDPDPSEVSSSDAGTYLMVVQAGADASTARPVGAVAVYWLCDDGVDPENKEPGDIVFNANPVGGADEFTNLGSPTGSPGFEIWASPTVVLPDPMTFPDDGLYGNMVPDGTQDADALWNAEEYYNSPQMMPAGSYVYYIALTTGDPQPAYPGWLSAL